MCGIDLSQGMSSSAHNGTSFAEYASLIHWDPFSRYEFDGHSLLPNLRSDLLKDLCGKKQLVDEVVAYPVVKVYEKLYLGSQDCKKGFLSPCFTSFLLDLDAMQVHNQIIPESILAENGFLFPSVT